MSSRPNTTGAIGGGMGPSQFPRRSHPRPINRIPERRLWSYTRPKFYIHDSSGSSQGGSSTQSSGGNSTTSDGRRVHTASPYGSFFVEDMDIDDSPADGHGQTRGTAAAATDLNNDNYNNRVTYQTSSAQRRPPSSRSQNDYALYRRQRSPTQPAPCLFESTEATYVGMPQPGALPAPPTSSSRPRRNFNVPQEREEEGTPSTLTATHRSQSNQNRPASWNREYRNHSNSPHNNSQARPAPREVLTGTARLPPPGSQAGSSPSNPDRRAQQSRGVTRTAWRK